MNNGFESLAQASDHDSQFLRDAGQPQRSPAPMSRGLAPPMGGAWNRRELIGATAAALLGGLSPSVAQAGPAALGEVVRWPRVTLLDGRPLDAAQLAGVATVVVFFSTQCPYCQRHNRHVDKLQRTTLGQPLQILAAAQDRNAQAVQDYLRRHDYRFAATLDERALHDALTPRRVIPLTCVIDRAGRLREVIPGEMFEEDVLGLAKWARDA